MTKYDVIVVGGGAAGMICGGFSGKAGAKTLIVEKMPRPARKILVTGKGRCNLTNDCNQEAFIKKVCTNPRFMYSSYSGFTAQDVMALFESLGIPLQVQRGTRVYPVSERAMDIADGMVKFVQRAGAEILTERPVSRLIIEDGKVRGIVTDDGEEIFATCVVVATGGKSYPGTGSTGDGYEFAKSAGHQIVSLRPSLVPVVTEEKWTAQVMGLSLKNVELRLMERGKKKPVYKDQGEMLFTHFGVSGPMVLSASAYMKKAASEYVLEIDMKPALTHEQLDARVVRDFEENVNKDYDNALFGLLPRALVPIVVKMSGIPRFTKVNQISKEQRLNLVNCIKAIKLTPESLRPVEEAVVTAGGVSVKEIDPKTLESKLVEGLFFAGEVVDVDAFTGGFNLQVAFSTGHSAGVSAAKKALEEKGEEEE